MLGSKKAALVAVVSAVVVVDSATATSSAYARADWEALLPGCEQARNFFEAAQCIVKNSPDQCFSMSTPVDLYQCFQEQWEWNGWEDAGSIMGDIFNAALVCLDPYHDCIQNGVDQALANLPPCVEQSAMDMAECFLENPAQCLVSCLAKTWDSPFEGLNIFDLLSCNGIEDNLVQPMCDVVSCCPPCLKPLEFVAECVVNDILDFGPWGTCDFTCQMARRTLRENHDEDGMTTSSSSSGVVSSRTSKNKESAMQIYEQCSSLIPGLFNRDQPSIQLLARSNFFDCVMKEALALYGGEDEEGELTDTDPVEEDGDPWWCVWC